MSTHSDRTEQFAAVAARQDIEQLHGTLIEVSKSCLEFKKLCATVLSAGLAFVGVSAKDTEATLPGIIDEALIGALVIVLVFWVLDSHAFSITMRFRERMKVRRGQLASYCGDNTYQEEGVGLPYRPKSDYRRMRKRGRGREDTAGANRAPTYTRSSLLYNFVRNAMLDDSMLFYWLLVAIALIAGVLGGSWLAAVPVG